MGATPTAIELILRPSRRIVYGLAALHVASAVLVSQLQLSGWSTAGLMAAIAAHGWWFVHRVGTLQAARSVTGISLDRDLRCRLRFRDGDVAHGEVDDTTMVTGSLVVIAVRSPGRWNRRRVVIASDMVVADDFRRLRVALRWGQRVQDPDTTHA